MEQIQYQSYESPEGFRPVRQPDIVPELRAEAARQQQARQAYLAGLQRNGQVAVQNARIAGQGLADLGKGISALGQLSKTLREKEVARINEANENALAAGTVEGLQQYARGELDTSSYDQTASGMRRQDRVVQDVAQDVMGDNGENFEASSYISGASAWREVGRRRGFATAAVGNYGAFMDQEMGNRVFNSSAEYAAARAEAQQKFFAASGIAQLDNKFLAASGIYEKIMRADASANRAWSKDFGIRQSQNAQSEMRASFLSDFDISTYQSGLRNTLGTDGKPLGNKGAWDQVVKTLTDARKGGLLSATDLEQIKNQIIPEGAPGAGKRYGDFYKARFGEIERAVRKQTQSDYNLGQQEKQRQMKEYEDNMIDSFLDPNDTDGFSDDQIEKAQATYMRFSGGRRSQRLDNLKKLTVDSETRKDQEKFVEGLISQGLLTEAELNKLDPEIQRKYRSTAQSQQKALQANNNNKVQLDAIKDRIEQKAGYSPMGKKHFTMGLKIAQQQNIFRQKYAAYMASGTMSPEAAANAALNDVLTNFETNHGWQGGVKGFSGVLPETANSSRFAAAARLEQLNEQMKYLQSYALDGAGKDGLFEVQELEQMMKGYGKPGYTIDPRLSYVAQQYGLSPLEVLNRQLKANNMELPPPPPSQEIINKLTPEQQRLLNTTPTVERSQRGMTGVTEFNGALLPSKAQPYASLIQQSAQKHGIDPSIMAGMLETESGWLPDVINGTRLSSAGAKGIAQFMPATAADYGVNPTDPASAIDGMARYMKDLLRMFNGDYRLAVTAYNAGQGNVMRYGGPIPGNAESQGYWPKVLKSAGKYGYGAQTLRDPAVMRSSSPVAGLAPLDLAAMGTTTTPINN